METGNNSFLDGSFLSSKYFNPAYWFQKESVFLQEFFSRIFTAEVRNFYYFILFILTTFFICLMAYCAVRMFEIRKKEHKHLEEEIAEYAHHRAERERAAQASGDVSDNPRWMKTLTYLLSSSSSDWKLAIIEADAMLDELMDQLGFRGETLGEKLKSADQEKFRNLTIAWEVHVIRNRIAHEGLAYEISQYEAKRVIALYEQIFRGYGFI
ncbi:MAG TPA: hypothetical protein VGO63_01425 [Candidatus Paceibacterota bacterium]|jgi:hypothetical protein|nr:hypothetical protein [Candidatus Paceibacterota bacterium]